MASGVNVSIQLICTEVHEKIVIDLPYCQTNTYDLQSMAFACSHVSSLLYGPSCIIRFREEFSLKMTRINNETRNVGQCPTLWSPCGT